MGRDNTQPKILNFSLDILSPYLSKGCRFEVSRCDNNEISYSLRDATCPCSREDAKGKSIPVLRMNNGYWLGCNFVYYRRRKNKRELKQFCLHFFDNESPLFRADWACSEIEESCNHAQPHWHFDSKSIIKKNENDFLIPSYEEYEDENQNIDETITLDLGRVHFFMNWDAEKENGNLASYLDFRDDHIFKNWLNKAMQYIDVELQSLAHR